MKILILLVFTLFSSLGLAFKAPTLTRPVHDESKILSADTVSKLESAIHSVYKDGKGPQLAVLIVPSLNGQDIKAAANEIFMQWRIGNKDRDDGVLFLIATKDRKTRIEVGQGLEGAITDLASKRIIDQAVIPFFKKGDYEGGIAAGVKEILQKMIQPDAVQQAAPSTKTTKSTNSTAVSAPQADNGESSIILGGAILVAVLIGVTLFWIYSLVFFNVQRKDFNEIKAKVSEVEKQEKNTLKNSIKTCVALNDKIDTEGDELERKINSLTRQKESSPQGLFEKSKQKLQYQVSETRSLMNETEQLKRLAEREK